MTALAFRNSLGRLIDVESIPASRAKGEFGSVLERAARGGAVAITRHDTPQAVMVSYAEFEALVAAASPTLGALESKFDDLLARMQSPQARHGMAAAFDATPAELGRSAMIAATTARKPVTNTPATRRRATVAPTAHKPATAAPAAHKPATAAPAAHKR